MTICIAAIGTGQDGKEIIVFATDHMISDSRIGQFELPLSKFKCLNKNAIAMLAGNPLLFDNIVKNCIKADTYNKAKETIYQNMNTIRSQIVQHEILDIYKMDYEYIKQVLQGPIENAHLDNIIRSISQYSLQTRILLVGFQNEEAQITEISENRTADHRGITFNAIGSGAVQAINTLLFQRHCKDETLPTTIYNVYKAKRNAEVSTGVGKETDLMVLTQTDGVCKIDPDIMWILEDIYDEELGYGKTHTKLKEALNNKKLNAYQK